LKNEGEIPIEQLRAMYANANFDGDDEDAESEPAEPTMSDDDVKPSLAALLMGSGDGDGEGEGDAYQPNEAEAVDDETTFEAEEKLGRDMSYEDEIALLKRENEMSVDELRAIHAKMNEELEADSHKSDGDEKMADSSDAESQKHVMEVDEEGDPAVRNDNDITAKRKREAEDMNVRTKKSRRETPGEGSDDGLAALNALEASAERARKTLATRPFLVPGWVKLRKYQQVGLNWLVSLQSRRLNGILADGKSSVCFMTMHITVLTNT
jgi:SNF2 family DNA or RNA helicase